MPVSGQYTVFTDLNQAKDYAKQQSSKSGTNYSLSQQDDGSYRVFPQFQSSQPTSQGTQPVPTTRNQYATQYPKSGVTPSTPAPKPQPSNDPYAGIDLSNRAKQDDYARQFGYPGWNEYQAALLKDQRKNDFEEQTRQADSLYNESFNYLNQSEQFLRGQLPSVIQEAEDQYNTSKTLLGGKKDSALNQLSEQERQTADFKEKADTQSVRLFNELKTAGQQIFGGSSSAGQAASEINARELQKRQGEILAQNQTALREIASRRLEADQDYQNSLLMLDQQKKLRLNEITQTFQSKMLELNSKRAELGTAKSQLKLDLLQSYKNEIFQLNVQEFNYKQQLDAQRAEYDLQLRNYEQLAATNVGSAQQALNNIYSSGAQTQMSVPGVTKPVEVQNVGSINQSEDQPQGIISSGIEALKNLVRPGFFNSLAGAS